MTAEPLPTGPHDDLVRTAAQACASLLPAAEPLAAGEPQAGGEHVTSIFAGAVVADLAGAVPGRLAVLVGDDLVKALAGSPFGGLDTAAAVQPALDAAATALGLNAQAGRSVDLDDVVADLGGDFTAIPLLGSAISGALLVPHAMLDALASGGSGGSGGSAAGSPASAADAVVAGTVEATATAPTGAPGAATPAGAGGSFGDPTGADPFSGLQTSMPHDNVRSIADGRRGIEMLHGVEMEVTVELGRTRMPVRDLLALAPGAVLTLDRAAGSPADLLVNGRLIARGEVVVVDEDFGLRITEIIDRSKVG
ncbi:MAG: flagellar motor switch protein FliN [Nocardioides sp.]|nr:flagellar motor switch protein FliN [Nocardioides sp.]